MDSVRIADEARLLYGWYPEAAANYAKAKSALDYVRKSCSSSRQYFGNDKQDEEIEAGELLHYRSAAESCRQCAKGIGDLALAVARVFPDLWPQLRLVAVGVRWHEKADFDWDAAVAELRRIETVALASTVRLRGMGNDAQTQPVLDNEADVQEGKGVAPRNAWFLTQYEARRADTYHKPKKIHDKWWAMTDDERAAICPDASQRVTHAVVVQGIKLARKQRHGADGSILHKKRKRPAASK